MKPILFKHQLVRAILEGRKTKTRRLVKSGIPKYCVGDVLYVREKWTEMGTDSVIYKADYLQSSFTKGDTLYLYPKGDACGGDVVRHVYDSYHSHRPTWKPSMHMPREAARLFLEVKSVRLEHLQEITEQGAAEEGCASVKDFITIWDKLTVARRDKERLNAWDKNPLVYVYEFKIKKLNRK